MIPGMGSRGVHEGSAEAKKRGFMGIEQEKEISNLRMQLAEVETERNTLRTKLETLKTTLTQIKEGFDIEGCGDSSCIIRKPTGMATNGGCRCGKDAFPQSALRPLRAYIQRAKHVAYQALNYLK